MATKPKYIADLEGRIDILEISHGEIKDNQAEFRKDQKVILEKLNAIWICLDGTEFDHDNVNGKGGGVVRRLSRTEKKVSLLEVWKTKVNTRNTVIWSMASAAIAAVWSYVLIKLKGQ